MIVDGGGLEGGSVGGRGILEGEGGGGVRVHAEYQLWPWPDHCLFRRQLRSELFSNRIHLWLCYSLGGEAG